MNFKPSEMHITLTRTKLPLSVVAIALSAATITVVAQTTYNFSDNSGGSEDWIDSTNWSGGAVPSTVAGDTIEFNLGLSTDLFFDLNSDRTFGNITAQLGGFDSKIMTIVEGYTITLDGGGFGTPTLDVDGGAGATLYMDALIAGSEGFIKTGGRLLALNNLNNSFTGDVQLNQGVLFVAGDGALGDASNGIDVTGNSSLQLGDGAVLNRDIFLDSDTTLDFNQGSNDVGVIAGDISGDGGIQMSGVGFSAFYDLTLESTNNTFTGDVVIGASNDGNKSLTVNSLADAVGSTLEIASSNKGNGLRFALGTGATSALVFDNRQLVLSGNKNKDVTIENTNTNTDVTININQDLLVTQTTSRNLVLDGVNEGRNTIAGISDGVDGAADSIKLVKNGAGTWILNGTNTYTGTTTVNDGILVFADKNAQASGAITAGNAGTIGLGVGVDGVSDYSDSDVSTLFNTGSLALSGGMNLGSGSGVAVDTTAGDFTLSSALTASRTLIKLGLNVLSLSGTNTYDGGTIINGGVVEAASADALGTLGDITFKGGVLRFTSASAANDYSNRIQNSTGAVSLDTNGEDVTFASIIDNTNTGGLNKAGLGTLTLSAANTFTGAITVDAGILSLGDSLALQNSVLDTSNFITGDASNGLKTTVTTLTLGGLEGTKDLDSIFTTTSGGYSGVTALTLNSQAGVSSSYSGAIADGATGMTITKAGSGFQTLSGANTYTGDTSINEGILTFANKAAKSSSSTVNVAAAGTVGLGAGGDGVTDYSETDVATLFNTGNLGGATGINLDAASGVAIDTSTGDFTQSTALTASRALSKLGANTLTLSGTNTFDGGLYIAEGKVQLGSTDALNSNVVNFYDGSTGTFALNGYSVTTNGLAGSASSSIVENGNAGAATLTIAGTGLNYSGNIQDGAGGGSLALSVSGDQTLSGVLSHTGGISVSGGNLAILNEGNTFSGDINLSGGELSLASNSDASNMLGSNNTINFTGDAQLSLAYNSTAAGDTYEQGISISDGVTATVRGSNQFYQANFTGALTGSGTLFYDSTGGNGGQFLTFSSTDNTFTGTIITNYGGNGNQGNAPVSVNSLGDGVNLVSNGTKDMDFTLGSSAVAPITLGSLTLSNTGGARIQNNSSDAASTISVSSNLVVSAAGAKTLMLGGDNTGDNSFSGNIVDGTDAVISVAKTGDGTWNLSGTNTYTGATDVNGGTLFVNGDNSAATGAVTVSAGIIGGNGTLGGDLILSDDAQFWFNPTSTLMTSAGTTVDLGDLAIADLLNLDPNLAPGTYTIIGGDATFDFSSVQNFGSANQVELGENFAYFQEGSLQLVVVPELSSFALLSGSLGLMLVMVRRRR
ncbi:hypothetical protein DDZ13_05560 [Coraliomargarita sinensis]|uniref:PEP-CTERM protein-sorting domain-containing protein n=1 Tax=Coraliomargarita sinensis TaxID=2174842 RepID=A0A317ZLD6_9BACT|nr:autotransporter-associated beta strand repeat-containing protein [Coraliomargarita sinensis]PXA04639.1 hypothetical protein DDZ13_05560 [Coraliomargarita sinensis]